MIRVACPQCGKGFKIDEKYGGRVAKCARCGAPIKIPKAADTEPVAAVDPEDASAETPPEPPAAIPAEKPRPISRKPAAPVPAKSVSKSAASPAKPTKPEKRPAPPKIAPPPEPVEEPIVEAQVDESGDLLAQPAADPDDPFAALAAQADAPAEGDQGAFELNDLEPAEPPKPPSAAAPAKSRARATAAPPTASAAPDDSELPAGTGPKSSGLAISSLITSIFGIVPGLGLIGLVLGMIAIRKINQPNSRTTGKGMAVAGIVIGAATIVLWIIAAIIIWLIFSFWKTAAPAIPAPVAAPVEAPPPPAQVTPAPPPAVKIPTGLVYFYDLNTGQLFPAAEEMPPIDAPSGKMPNGEAAGVRAYVFSCGDCADAKQRTVVWLVKGSPNAKKLADEHKADPTGATGSLNIDQLIDAQMAPLKVSNDQGKTWTDKSQAEAMALGLQPPTCQGGGNATPCMPD